MASIKLLPIDGCPFGAVLSDIDCAALSSGQLAEIRQALHEHQLLVLREQQHLTPKQEVDFYRGYRYAWRYDLAGSGQQSVGDF